MAFPRFLDALHGRTWGINPNREELAVERRRNSAFDVVVVGAGHAGCEAALAAARVGLATALITISADAIARMSCNPAIGGLAKGQMVREVDALGGEMAKVIDCTGIHFRMLNRGRGSAVHAPRAQADRQLYSEEMRRRLVGQTNLTVVEGVVNGLLVRDGRCVGVRTEQGEELDARAVVLTTGTFLKGVIHIGEQRTTGGRIGEPSAEHLSDDLRRWGFALGRLKTGTPPRLRADTIDFDKCQVQYGEDNPTPFSFANESIDRPNVPCWITYTNEGTHEIIRSNLDRAPLYTGQIKAVGPRYCPSIEAKVVRFADKAQHQIFIEPEGLDHPEVYCNGLATSVPRDVQEQMVHSIGGLEHAEITRYGYAIEYDFVPPTQLKASLESKVLENLFLAGQINGTSGYEEAAAQGIIAGINASRKIRGEAPLILDRSQAFTGVLIDDLVTRGTEEPYRMFTSRAEYRLVLRHDNADRRLMRLGHASGLVSQAQIDALEEKEEAIGELVHYLDQKRHGTKTLAKILRRPQVSFRDIEALDATLAARRYPAAVIEQVEIAIKYEGYLARQAAAIEKFRKLEQMQIPADFDYRKTTHLKSEARQKLMHVMPTSLGQASRISGVTPADVSVLVVELKRHNSRREPLQEAGSPRAISKSS